MPRFDDLPGEFTADLDISFALLNGVGFEPVHADHPAHANYLAASAAHAVAPAEPVHAPDLHAPDLIVMPFETTITISNEMALRHGLVPPGHPDSAWAHPATAARPVRRKPVPPPIWRASGVGAVPLPPPGGDIGAFLDSLEDA
ncbi:hypothetical protein NFI95_12255 [Acetobacteraceae bacterium KSS8]|uniref:Uncharacterized protein n=1 Tax=Endosaccharibacter trunci TaxID=2812733 RepID=A0ABT1W8K1_9PROT|nr:hypothetical protein [Acetobacteraceae bacterium KSS8]